MKYEEIKIEYKNALNDIIEKAEDFSSIKNLNDYMHDFIFKYEKLMRPYKSECHSFIDNYNLIKDKHLGMLKIKLKEYNLNKELELLKEGNVIDYIDIIENYIKNNKYLEEISLIIAINIYSSFKSIRNNLKKVKHPHLFEFISKEKHSLQFKSFCPFCKKDINFNLFKKTKPSFYDFELEEISKCNCNYPLRSDNKIEYLEKINSIINPNNNFSISLKNEFIEKLKNYAKEKYPNFYKINNNSLTLYEEEKDFKICPINKKIWFKIKRNDLHFNRDETYSLGKIPNALVHEITLFSLENIIEDLEISTREKYIDTNNISYPTTELYINIKKKNLEESVKVNSQLIAYIQNYQKKISIPEEVNQNEVLALGHYCKSQNITMHDIDKFVVLSNFCNMHAINFDEIKDLITKGLFSNDDL